MARGEQWEYLVVKLETYEEKKQQEYLNDLGNEGWELVAVTPYVHEGGVVDISAYLKRRRG